MMNTSTFKRFVYASAAAAALMLAGGALSTVHGQRDPFQKPGYMKPRPTTGPGSAVAKPKVEVNYGPPAIEARIEYFKHMREMAAANGQPLPKEHGYPARVIVMMTSCSWIRSWMSNSPSSARISVRLGSANFFRISSSSSFTTARIASGEASSSD